MSCMLLIPLSVAVALLPGQALLAGTLPENFQNLLVVNNLQDPSSFEFSPDGRIFISERITGNLLVATEDRLRANG